MRIDWLAISFLALGLFGAGFALGLGFGWDAGMEHAIEMLDDTLEAMRKND